MNRIIKSCSQCTSYDRFLSSCMLTHDHITGIFGNIPNSCPLPVAKEETPEKFIRIIAVDFDGVLNSGKYPDVSHPNWEIIRKAKKEKESGSKLILWTSRADDALKEAVKACISWGLEFDAVNDNIPEIIEMFNGSNPRKVTATEYWDDRAVRIGNEG